MGAFSGPETADSGIVLALDAQNPLSVGNTSVNVWEDVVSSTTTVSSVGVITCLSVDIATNKFFGIKHSSCLISGSAVWDNRPPSVSDMNEILSGNLTCKSYQTGTYDQVQYYFGAYGNAGNVCTLRFTGFGVGAVIGVGGYFNAVTRQCRLTGDLQNSPVTITSPSGGFADPIVLTSDPADIQFSNPGSSGDPMYVYWLGPYNQVPYNTLRSRYGTLTNGPVFTQEPKLEPFGGAGAVSFDGNSDSLTVPASTDFTLDGEFTAEFWIYLNTIVLDSQHPSPITFSQSGGNKGQIYVNANNNYFGLWDGSSNVVTTGNNSITTGTWYHVAVTRDASNNCRIFLDGDLKQTASDSFTFGNASGDLRIGSYNGTGGDVNGYISNLRLIKGTALYTSNFTPPTKPLTAVTNTKLLTCQGNTIADASSSAHTITANGDISLTKEPFAGAGAVDFGGSADGLYTPNITLGSNDWTLEFWIYLTSTGTARGLYSYMLGNTPDRQISYSIDSSNQFGWQHRLNDGTYPSAAGSTALSAHTWYHVAAVRVNDDYYTYINGVQDSSYTSAPAGHTYYADGVPHYIGYNRTGTSDFDGLLSNVRFVNGTALYTSNFTPPAEPLTAVTNTELLTCQGQGIKDASSNAHTITVNGDAKATIVSSAFEFDGSDDYIDLGDTFDDIIAGADKKFTIESWVNPDSVSGNKTIVSKYGDSNFSENTRQFQLRIDGDEVKTYVWFGQSGDRRDYATSSANLTAGSWHHIVLVYDGSIDAAGRFTFYVNGQNEAATETYSSGSWGDIQDTTSRFAIGAVVGANVANSPLSPFDGKISNTKIYSRLLTAAEVTQNYNATKGRYA